MPNLFPWLRTPAELAAVAAAASTTTTPPPPPEEVGEFNFQYIADLPPNQDRTPLGLNFYFS